MERIDKIVDHAVFKENLERNKAAERDRRFCGHDMSHFLDVARIGTILSLEEGDGIDRELIYAAALLHDIGKNVQYSQGIPHDRASENIASLILKDCGFDQNEISVILDAVRSHRDSAAVQAGGLKSLLYRADKASRTCFACDAGKDCNWKEDRKNLQVRY